MDIEERLKEMLVPVLGLGSSAEIEGCHSLVRDLGADSIDFVEIVYLVEKQFGVVLKSNEMIAAGIRADDLFEEGRLSVRGASMIHAQLPGSESRYQPGMTKVDLFSSLTVQNLVHIIRQRQETPDGGPLC